MPRSKSLNHDAVRFGAIINRLRLERGWTIAKLAQRSGMSAPYLGILEKGGNIPSLTTILELSDVFGVDPGDVVREVFEARRPRKASAFRDPERAPT